MHDSNDWDYLSDWYEERTEHFIDLFHELSQIVDQTPTTNPKLEQLRNSPSLDMEFMLPNKTGTYFEKLPLRVATSYVSAFARTSLALKLSSDAEDHWFFYVVSNCMTRLPHGMELNTQYVLEELRDHHNSMIVVAGVLFGCSVAALVFVSLVFVRPIVMRIERSKAHVRTIFQEIPYSLRRALRRKAYGVYKLVSRSRADEKLQRDMGDDEHDPDAHLRLSSAASAFGSSYTVNTRVTAASLSSEVIAESDAYAEVFRKFQEAKAKDGDTAPDAPAPIIFKPSPYPLENNMRGRSSRAGMAINEARAPAVPATTDDERDSEAHLRIPEPVSAASTSFSSGSASASRALHGGLASSSQDLPGASSTAGTELSQEDLRMASCKTRPQHNALTSSAALRGVVVKFLLFFALVAVYYAVYIWQIYERSQKAEVAAHTTDVAHSRSSFFQLAHFHTTQHLFYVYSDLILDPINANTRDGEFSSAGLRRLEGALSAQRGILYGDDALGLPRQSTSAEQYSLLHDSVCDLDRARAIELYADFAHYPRVIDNCASFLDGIQMQGLHAVIEAAADYLREALAPENSKILTYKISNTPPPPQDAIRGPQIFEVISKINPLVNDYLVHLLYVSGAMYREVSIAIVHDMDAFLVVLTAIFCVLLVVAYLAIFHPLADALYTQNAETKAVMLLAPGEIMRHVESAQAYIKHNMSSD
jgi:hypothetical protein